MEERLFGKDKDYDMRTKGGYEFDEVASALQKSIRRGMEYDALYWAFELFESGYWKYVFRRLTVIAMEDVGWSNPMAVTQMLLVNDLVQQSKTPVEGHLLAYVVIGLVRSVKSREADEAYNFVHEMRKQERKDIPDYAIDKHTKQGKARGRDLRFFWENGALLDRERPSKYKEDLYKLLRSTWPDLKMPEVHIEKSDKD